MELPPPDSVTRSRLLLSFPEPTDRQSATMAVREILLIDDHAMVREGLRLLLSSNAALECRVHEASTLAEGLAVLARGQTIDWVLLDLGLPDVGGVAAVTRLRAAHETVPIVVLTGAEDRALVLECINAGAMGFIGKSSSSAVLAEALLHVFAGGIYLPPALVGGDGRPPRATEEPVASRAQLDRLNLTPRQVDVFELMVQGLPNKVIARRLGLAEPTVKTHVAAGLRALNVRNRTQAVIALARLGQRRA